MEDVFQLLPLNEFQIFMAIRPVVSLSAYMEIGRMRIR